MLCECGREEMQFNFRARSRVLTRVQRHIKEVVCSICVQRMLRKKNGKSEGQDNQKIKKGKVKG